MALIIILWERYTSEYNFVILLIQGHFNQLPTNMLLCTSTVKSCGLWKTFGNLKRFAIKQPLAK